MEQTVVRKEPRAVGTKALRATIGLIRLLPLVECRRRPALFVAWFYGGRCELGKLSDNQNATRFSES